MVSILGHHVAGRKLCRFNTKLKGCYYSIKTTGDFNVLYLFLMHYHMSIFKTDLFPHSIRLSHDMALVFVTFVFACLGQPTKDALSLF